MIKYWCTICNRYHDGTSSAACGALTLIPPTNTVNTGLYPEDGKAEIIAARDKWFIKTIEDRFGDGHDKPLIQIGVQDWQDFKREVGQ